MSEARTTPDTNTSTTAGPVRLGIIGGGIMGERLLRAAAGQDSVRIAGLWDPAPEAVARLRAELPETQFLASAAAVIEASDCVYVASPPATHLAHARATLKAGRALFCEKPLAVDVADAGRFLREAKGARCAINFPFASSPTVERLREWLDAGAVGQPRHLAIAAEFARWPRGWQHAAAGWLDGPAQGGFTREVVSHFLFLARRLFGPLALSQARALFPEAGRSEREIEARLTAGGLPLALSGSVGRVGADEANGFTVTGSQGAIRLRNWALAERLGADGAWEGDPSAMPHEKARPLTLQRQLDGVARMTRGEPHHLATLEEAYEVQATVEAILRSGEAPLPG
ncbi:MAG: gfo/Idh/MocA family oxidoreductase [Azospirillum brasilense]|uniref:Oxidoreductase n=1 Tax=Roseomonas gilardii TaxID=257708 RepID=A0A1L7ADD7_9PROT|nr:Gfo/Idh/MocA family oxidoreductase [Roseomonas gilardii]APT56792.1 oxidoreductase [Roseomonas gilardii]PZR11353.1 MAG: gfo/Idh/MocA family oxidoreductase [Azospirillum brasilense]